MSEDIRNINSDTRDALIDFDAIIRFSARVNMFSDKYLENLLSLVERWLNEDCGKEEPHIHKFMKDVYTFIRMETLDRICDKVQEDIKNAKA